MKDLQATTCIIMLQLLSKLYKKYNYPNERSRLTEDNSCNGVKS